MPRIFISRELRPDSIFLKKMTTIGWEVHGESLITFSGIPFEPIPTVNWIFFYSKNAIQFFFKNLTDQKNLASIQFATIGEGSAKMLAEIFQTPNFIGNGHPQQTAEAFLKVAKGQSVLFPRARNSRQSIQRLLSNQLEAIDLVIYENQIRKGLQLPNFEMLVFTSPLNATAYFEEHKQSVQQKVFAIGNTTAATLQNLGIKEILVAKAPSETALVEVVMRFI